MKFNNLIVIIIYSILMLFIVTAAPAYCQVDDYVLLIEQTPVQGGKVTPSAGVHKFGPDEVITLRAEPNPGYKFVYWMGDVSEVANTSTTTLLDGPKIIIAVFERAKFVFILEEEPPGIGLGNESTINNYTYIGGGSEDAIGYKNPKEYELPPPEEDEFPVPELDFPVPEPDFPVPKNEEPIPEPATIALMGFGALGFVRKRWSG